MVVGAKLARTKKLLAMRNGLCESGRVSRVLLMNMKPTD